MTLEQALTILSLVAGWCYPLLFNMEGKAGIRIYCLGGCEGRHAPYSGILERATLTGVAFTTIACMDWNSGWHFLIISLCFCPSPFYGSTRICTLSCIFSLPDTEHYAHWVLYGMPSTSCGGWLCLDSGKESRPFQCNRMVVANFCSWLSLSPAPAPKGQTSEKWKAEMSTSGSCNINVVSEKHI